MKQNFILFFIFFFQALVAQNSSGKIIDSKSGESIPYANIMVNNSENLISNSEGYFTLSESSSGNDNVLTISYLGYVNLQLTVSELKNLQNIIKLEPGIIELNEVNISNVKPNPYEIMANVKANLERNYKNNGQGTKDMIFFRESSAFKPSILDIVIDKSTGFTKQELKSANAQMNSFSSKLIEQPTKEYTDMLFNYYSVKTKKDDKPFLLSKLEVTKATKLKNENSSASLEEMEKSAKNIMLTHLDTTKYYRIKSGLFGSRDTISMRKDFKSKKKKVKSNQLTNSKANLASFLTENNLRNKTKLDFIQETELYEYIYEGAIYSNENEFVYVISFKSRKNKGNYKGKLYISETDYAVIRTDYTLEEGKKVSGFNMKFLLGVKTSENVSKGTLIYKKDPIGEGYYMHYASKETGQYIYQ
jgi:CarboxypepD_reg-like domain